MTDLNSIIAIVHDMNRESGKIVRKYYGTGLFVETKADSSPVTRADREVELYLREQIERHFPDHSIIGEEFGETRKSSAYRWVIDPIDGTQSFLLRTPLFGTLLALECDGVPVLGSVYFPIQDQLLLGSDETGTFYEGKRCFVSGTAEPRCAKLVITDPTHLLRGPFAGALGNLCRIVSVVRGFGDCYGYFLVACGAADIMIDPFGVKRHDLAAIQPILEGAGGRLTSLNGFSDLDAGNAIATNSKLHAQILRILNPELADNLDLIPDRDLQNRSRRAR
ncbi:MAG TPA: inositol monophosphatase family protein [Blastocatellia bacterium]|nr:inositol monophosphatase family protein [Blastocatellia bacterium]